MGIKCKNPCVLGKFDGCCHGGCPHVVDCPEKCSADPSSCEDAIHETGDLVAFQTSQIATLNQIAALTVQKKKLEEQEKSLKSALYDAMMKFGVDKFDSDVLTLTLVQPTTATAIDTAKVKKNYPQVAAECSKTTSRAGYVKITVKEGGTGQ